MEPVFWWEMPTKLIEEFVHLFNPSAVIDCNASAGGWAIHCVEKNIPYVGFVLSDVHLESLSTRLTATIDRLWRVPGSKLQQRLGSITGGLGADDDGKEKPSPKKKPKKKQDQMADEEDEQSDSGEDSHSSPARGKRKRA